MTIATAIGQVPAAIRHSAPRARGLAAVAVASGGVSLLIRLVLADRSFDLFGDEVIYADLGHSVASGGFPRFGGQLFFLHPPGFFYLEAGWQRIWGNQPDVVARIYEMRSLNALLAGATAVVLVLVVGRAGSVRAAGAAGLLFAVDPFCIRQNDRVLLETAMACWVLLGYLAFTSAMRRLPPRRGWAHAAAAGAAFGCGILTKDEAALLTVAPLVTGAALGWVPRRLAWLTAGTAMGCYAAYVAAVAAAGHFGALWEAKTTGVQRLLGLIQTTGFHGRGGGSLSSRLTGEARYFAATYVILALAVPALVLVLRRGGPLPRMFGLLYGAAAAALGYALTLGTLEEQELYLLLIPSLMILPIAVPLLRGERAAKSPRAVAITAALALVLSVNLATCEQWMRHPDSGYEQLLGYLAAHVQARSAITAVDGTDEAGITQYALAGRYDVGRWVTPAARAREHVRYVVVPWAELSDGYSYLSPAQVRHLVSGGRLVFSFCGRTYGHLGLYRLPPPVRHYRSMSPTMKKSEPRMAVRSSTR